MRLDFYRKSFDFWNNCKLKIELVNKCCIRSSNWLLAIHSCILFHSHNHGYRRLWRYKWTQYPWKNYLYNNNGIWCCYILNCKWTDFVNYLKLRQRTSRYPKIDWFDWQIPREARIFFRTIFRTYLIKQRWNRLWFLRIY